MSIVKDNDNSGHDDRRKRMLQLRDDDFVKMNRDVKKAGIGVQKGEVGKIICITGHHDFFLLEFKDGRAIEVPASFIDLVNK